MTISDWLNKNVQTLEQNGISNARLDCIILLEDILSKDRAWLLAHQEFIISEDSQATLEKLVERRCNHEPLSYIRGHCEFYGRDFKVTPMTLQPRSETETMIELFMSISSQINTVIDVGTGSGAIAITLKLEKPNLKIYATDINVDALLVAKQNMKALQADVTFLTGDLLAPLENGDKISGQKTVIVANLPYVPDDFTINQAAMQEPKLAIYGGKDGLDLYRKMFKQIDGMSKKPVFVFTESLPFQHQTLEQIAANSGYKTSDTQDLIKVFEFA